MTLADFNALLEEHNVKPEVEPHENVPVVDLGIDSFEVLMILGDLENAAGISLELSLDSTVGEVLEKMTAAGK
ncbi:MAG: hypothetical protein IKX42_12275 [Fibrobacter sp.]|jgi:acyl carrier protein|nr:hypothetical protein [Fibrobacter sp.]